MNQIGKKHHCGLLSFQFNSDQWVLGYTMPDYILIVLERKKSKNFSRGRRKSFSELFASEIVKKLDFS